MFNGFCSVLCLCVKRCYQLSKIPSSNRERYRWPVPPCVLVQGTFGDTNVLTAGIILSFRYFLIFLFDFRSMGPVDEMNEVYFLDCYFRQSWVDKRLRLFTHFEDL